MKTKTETEKALGMINHATNISCIMLEALEAIANLDPEYDSDDGYNEWGEAECFTKAQNIAQAALIKAKGETK